MGALHRFIFYLLVLLYVSGNYLTSAVGILCCSYILKAIKTYNVKETKQNYDIKLYVVHINDIKVILLLRYNIHVILLIC